MGASREIRSGSPCATALPANDGPEAPSASRHAVPIRPSALVGRSSDYVRTSDEGDKDLTFHFCPDGGATVFFTGLVGAGSGRRSGRRIRRSVVPGADRLGLRVTTASVAGSACGDGTPRLKATSGDGVAWRTLSLCHDRGVSHIPSLRFAVRRTGNAHVSPNMVGVGTPCLL